MTKSVLAHLVGRAVRAGDLRLEDPVAEHVPELAGSGYAGCTVEHVLTMTTGTDWVEDHRDPTGPATRLISCFAGEGGDSRALLTEVAPTGPARIALGVQHRRLAGPRLGARTSNRHDVRRGADRAVGHARLRPRRGRGRRRPWCRAGRRWAGGVRGGLAPVGRAPAHRHGVRRDRARPRVGAPLLRSPAAVARGRAGCRPRSPPMPASATTGGRSTPGRAGDLRRQPRPVRLRRPRPRGRGAQDLAVALRRLPRRPAAA